MKRLHRCQVQLIVTIAFALTAAAQPIRGIWDPTCGLPALDLTGNGSPGDYRLSGVDDLQAGNWESLLDLTLGGDSTRWHDVNGHAKGRRFYRLEKLKIRPPRIPVENFRLIDHSGVARELHREGDASVVVLMFGDNSEIQTHWPAIKSLAEKYQPSGTVFWLINPRDTRDEIADFARTQFITLPILHDRSQAVSRAFGCTHAFEVIALDNSDLSAFYEGALEHACETSTGTVHRNYLADALDSFFAGKSPQISRAVPAESLMPLRNWGTLDYSRDIAPVLIDKCVRCHSPGNIGSYAMTNHEAIATRSGKIRRDLLTGDMPPWHADPRYPALENDFSLAPADVDKLVAWLDAGALRGNGPDILATTPPPAPSDWGLGIPDYIIDIDEQSVPAAGTVDYRYLFVESPFTTNVWLRATVLKPGNRAVVHHGLVFAASSLQDLIDIAGGLNGYFAAYVPGLDPVEFPGSTGKLLKAKSTFVFQMHYTVNGTETTDRSQLGLYFSRQIPTQELKTKAGYSTQFVISPNSRTNRVVATTTFPKPTWLYEVGPHMHYRGQDMQFEAQFPNGKREVLVSVPAYRFDWQTLYRLASPRLLPAGTIVRVSGGFDNTQWNPKNPDPNATVKFGQQSWEEMFIGYLNVAEDL